jgi:hypothetical protein
MAYRLSEKITLNKEITLMRSGVAIGMALSHGNVNSTVYVDDGISILMSYICSNHFYFSKSFCLAMQSVSITGVSI